MAAKLYIIRVHEYLKGVFTHNVKSVLSENVGGILGGTQC